MSIYKWLERREYGYPSRYGDQDFIIHRMYSSFEPYNIWNEDSNIVDPVADHGAIFNLEFSPEGNVLLAACEKKNVLLYDPTTTQKIRHFEAHNDSVNYIRFINDKTFATCSDDTTIALWDLRNMNKRIRSLSGHTNWVKNVEYSTKDHLLVTSGFDGTIFTWDINAQTEQSLIYQKVFQTSGLMRSRLTPDGTKLVISTTGGYLMIVHDLDLTTLQKDLAGFRPSIFRLMQLGRQYIPQAAKYDYVFSKRMKKNRVELVTDFPKDNDAEIIMSLQIHPNGHSFLSRNISYNTLAEWLCVHSIIEEPRDITDPNYGISPRKRPKTDIKLPNPGSDEAEVINPDLINQDDQDYQVPPPRRRLRLQNQSLPNQPLPSPRSIANPIRFPSEPFVPDIWAAEVTLEERAIRQNRARASNSVHGYNLVYAISSGVLPIPSQGIATPSMARSSATNSSASPSIPSTNNRNDNFSPEPSSNSSSSSSNGSQSSSSSSSASPSSGNSNDPISCLVRPKRRYGIRRDRPIFHNPKKLMYYIEDSPAGKGLIKEPCFSNDGRIIASPYENGARLLAYNEQCSDYPYYEIVKNKKPKPQELQVLKHLTHFTKNDNLLSCKFSPREPLLVGAYQSGKIAWYHPNF